MSVSRKAQEALYPSKIIVFQGKELKQTLLLLCEWPSHLLLGGGDGKRENWTHSMPSFFTRIHVHVQVWEVFLCAWMGLAMPWDFQISWFVVDILQCWLGSSLKTPDPRTTWLYENTAVIQKDKGRLHSCRRKKAKPSKIQCELRNHQAKKNPKSQKNPYKLRWFVLKNHINFAFLVVFENCFISALDKTWKME